MAVVAGKDYADNDFVAENADEVRFGSAGVVGLEGNQGDRVHGRNQGVLAGCRWVLAVAVEVVGPLELLPCGDGIRDGVSPVMGEI